VEAIMVQQNGNGRECRAETAGSPHQRGLAGRRHAALLGVGIVRFVLGFSVIYWLSYLAWVLGNYAYIAVTTPADMQRLAIGWSLRLTGESGYLIALLLGLAIH
jgi:hypothetical protein